MSELEAAVADVGALLVRARKYRRFAAAGGPGLEREAFAVGDRARALHRRQALDAGAARVLRDQARAIGGRLAALVAETRAAPEYRAAVAAHGAADAATLGRTLPAIFAGLEPVPAPPDLFHAVAWRRRGRPRPPADLAAAVARARAEGIAPEGDERAPGVDPELPAVVLTAEPPADEPLLLRLAAADAPHVVHRLADSGEYLVHLPALRAPFETVLRTAPESDEIETGLADFDAWRDGVAAALAVAGVRAVLV